MTYKLEIIVYPATVTPLPLHDGTNGSGQPPKYLKDALAQAGGADVFFGGPNISGDADAFTLCKGDCARFTGVSSRGETDEYDLTEMYYVGGSFKLIVDRASK